LEAGIKTMNTSVENISFFTTSENTLKDSTEKKPYQ
jgi:ABC-type transport system involved in cytochrome c biogenesis ATPase subunit